VIICNDADDGIVSAKAKFLASSQMVNRILDRIVADITEDEPGKHRRGEAAYVRRQCPTLRKGCVALAENIRSGPLPR